MNNKEIDNILDQQAEQIRAEKIDAATVSAAAERVWARVSVEADAGGMHAKHPQDAGAPSATIGGCADFQSLIPAYLRGELSEARSLLLVDHTHECIPCRRAMKQARVSRADVVQPARQRQKYFGYQISPIVKHWGIDAAILIAVGLVAL